jgi:hypothetical protein
MTETVTSEEQMPICLAGDRLQFVVACTPTLAMGGVVFTAEEHEGDSWDGATIFRWAWTLIGHPLCKEFRWASYWHDRLCEASETIEDRTVADAVFLKLLRDEGVARWRRIGMWIAVRFYGLFIWRAKRA